MTDRTFRLPDPVPRRAAALAAAVAAAAAAVLPAAPARAGTSQNTSSGAGQNDAPAGTRNPAVTISLSGSTAMRNFTTAPGFSFLTPGATGITLNNGAPAAGGARAPVLYRVDDGGDTQFQFASSQFNVADFHRGSLTDPTAVNGPWPQTARPVQQHSAARIEWHEQGSVEGILELANDQIGTVGTVAATNRNPTGSGSTPVWVNQGRWNAARPQGAGLFNGHALNEFYASPGATSGTPVFANTDGVGSNPNGGQNAVQMAISDVNARQGFSRGGATGGFNLRPGDAGYGKGNPALQQVPGNISGKAVGDVRRSLEDEGVLNMAAAARNPRTGSTSTSGDGANFGAGPWNTAGINNLDNRTVAITATLIAANPGTGLERVNRTDARWLQATGRLRNGADFNAVTRDVNSGTLNVAALNVGLDPSFAVGENDNGNSGAEAEAQNQVGPNIRFSGKLSGSGALRPTVQNSRMAVGHLSISDSVIGAGGSNHTVNTDTRPIRGLDFANAEDSAGGPTFVRPGAANIVDGSYALFQNQTYVTVKRPDAAFAGDSQAQWAARTDADTGIQGDNSGNDVADVRGNILSSVAQFPQTTTETPADALINTGFIIPQLMAKRKDVDGGAVTDNPGYDATRSAQFLSEPSLTSRFAVGGNVPGASGRQVDVDTGSGTNRPGNVTTGVGSAYGGRTGAGSIAINSNNFLFGDFDQRVTTAAVSGKGVRDLSDLDVARRAQAALQSSGLTNSMFATGTTLNANNGTAVPNATFAEVGFAPTKGDLIVMGDYDSDGDFDGEDLRRMARGTSLADSRTSATLSGGAAQFADKVRTGVLRKNAALDQLQAATADFAANPASAAQRQSASASAANDPTGTNAFNKFDVNRDGRVNRADAQIVDYFVTKDYTNLDHQLDAVVRIQAGGAVTAFVDAAGDPLDPRSPANAAVARRPISLVDVELDDTGDVTHVLAGGASDMRAIRDALSPTNGLRDGDSNFDGVVDIADFSRLAQNYLGAGKKWSTGDFTFDGTVDIADFSALAQNYLGTSDSLLAEAAGQDWYQNSPLAFRQDLDAAFADVVPEPGAVGVVAAAALGLLSGRRRQRHG